MWEENNVKFSKYADVLSVESLCQQSRDSFSKSFTEKVSIINDFGLDNPLCAESTVCRKTEENGDEKSTQMCYLSYNESQSGSFDSYENQSEASLELIERGQQGRLSKPNVSTVPSKIEPNVCQTVHQIQRSLTASQLSTSGERFPRYAQHGLPSSAQTPSGVATHLFTTPVSTPDSSLQAYGLTHSHVSARDTINFGNHNYSQISGKIGKVPSSVLRSRQSIQTQQTNVPVYNSGIQYNDRFDCIPFVPERQDVVDSQLQKYTNSQIMLQMERRNTNLETLSKSYSTGFLDQRNHASNAELNVVCQTQQNPHQIGSHYATRGITDFLYDYNVGNNLDQREYPPHNPANCQSSKLYSYNSEMYPAISLSSASFTSNSTTNIGKMSADGENHNKSHRQINSNKYGHSTMHYQHPLTLQDSATTSTHHLHPAKPQNPNTASIQYQYHTKPQGPATTSTHHLHHEKRQDGAPTSTHRVLPAKFQDQAMTSTHYQYPSNFQDPTTAYTYQQHSTNFLAQPSSNNYTRFQDDPTTASTYNHHPVRHQDTVGDPVHFQHYNLKHHGLPIHNSNESQYSSDRPIADDAVAGKSQLSSDVLCIKGSQKYLSVDRSKNEKKAARVDERVNGEGNFKSRSDSKNREPCSLNTHFQASYQTQNDVTKNKQAMIDQPQQAVGLFNAEPLTVSKKTISKQKCSKKIISQIYRPKQPDHMHEGQTYDDTMIPKFSSILEHTAGNHEETVNIDLNEHKINKIRQKQLPMYTHSLAFGYQLYQQNEEKRLDLALNEKMKLFENGGLNGHVANTSKSLNNDSDASLRKCNLAPEDGKLINEKLDNFNGTGFGAKQTLTCSDAYLQADSGNISSSVTESCKNKKHQARRGTSNKDQVRGRYKDDNRGVVPNSASHTVLEDEINKRYNTDGAIGIEEEFCKRSAGGNALYKNDQPYQQITHTNRSVSHQKDKQLTVEKNAKSDDTAYNCIGMDTMKQKVSGAKTNNGKNIPKSKSHNTKGKYSQSNTHTVADNNLLVNATNSTSHMPDWYQEIPEVVTELENIQPTLQIKNGYTEYTQFYTQDLNASTQKLETSASQMRSSTQSENLSNRYINHTIPVTLDSAEGTSQWTPNEHYNSSTHFEMISRFNNSSSQRFDYGKQVCNSKSELTVASSSNLKENQTNLLPESTSSQISSETPIFSQYSSSSSFSTAPSQTPYEEFPFKCPQSVVGHTVNTNITYRTMPYCQSIGGETDVSMTSDTSLRSITQVSMTSIPSITQESMSSLSSLTNSTVDTDPDKQQYILENQSHLFCEQKYHPLEAHSLKLAEQMQASQSQQKNQNHHDIHQHDELQKILDDLTAENIHTTSTSCLYNSNTSITDSLPTFLQGGDSREDEVTSDHSCDQDFISQPFTSLAQQVQYSQNNAMGYNTIASTSQLVTPVSNCCFDYLGQSTQQQSCKIDSINSQPSKLYISNRQMEHVVDEPHCSKQTLPPHKQRNGMTDVTRDSENQITSEQVQNEHVENEKFKQLTFEDCCYDNVF